MLRYGAANGPRNTQAISEIGWLTHALLGGRSRMDVQTALHSHISSPSCLRTEVTSGSPHIQEVTSSKYVGDTLTILTAP